MRVLLEKGRGDPENIPHMSSGDWEASLPARPDKASAVRGSKRDCSGAGHALAVGNVVVGVGVCGILLAVAVRDDHEAVAAAHRVLVRPFAVVDLVPPRPP